MEHFPLPGWYRKPTLYLYHPDPGHKNTPTLRGVLFLVTNHPQNFQFCGTRLLVGLFLVRPGPQKHPDVAGCFISGDKSPTKFSILRGPITGRTLSRPTGPTKTPRRCGVFYFWWPWSDSNRHSLQNLILSQARLPIPPRGQRANPRQIILPRLCVPQPFLPDGHCDLPCALAFLLVFRPHRFSCLSPF